MVPYAKRMEKMAFTANVVKGLFGSMTNPDIISFSGGSPAREALPVDTIRQLADEVLRTDTRGVEALQYGPIEGIRDLREVVVRELLAPKGIDCGVDNVIIITGGLEGINLACQAYIDPGDVILVEAPTFVQSVEIFDMFEARCVGVAMDDNGLIPEDLERKIRQCHPKMIYVIPTFQNPSGRTLSLERRKAVAELAAKYDVLVLEDDPYRDIRYSGEDLPPIKHFDTTGHVVMAGSFSKIFSPGSRLGYVVADTETIQHLVDVKSATNSHTSMLPQILCAEFFKRGCYPAHHQMICDLYRRRRDVMLQSIDRYFPAGTKHSNPDGGLFTWVELPGGIDTSALLQESSTDPAVNVAFVAGEGFFSDRDGQGKNCMRMSFGNTPEDLIEEGVRRLGGLICSKLNKALCARAVLCSLQLVQGQGEAVHKGLQKVRHFRQFVALQGFPGLAGGLPEFVVAGFQLLYTLDISGELVRRLHHLPHLRVGLRQDGPVHPLKLRRQHVEQLALRHRLHVLVGVSDGRVVVLDGGGHVAGQDLAGVMVQRRHRHGAGVQAAAELLVADHRQSVGQDGHLMTVLLDVLRRGVAHQGPPLDEPHPGDVGKEMALHVSPPKAHPAGMLRQCR